MTFPFPFLMPRVLVEKLVGRTLGTAIGNMTNGGGLAAAFDGVTSQDWGQSANRNNGGNGYVGKSYPRTIIFSRAVVYPANNFGFSSGTATVSVYGKSGSAPSSGTDGVVLGTTGPITGSATTPVTITSTDKANKYDHIWLYVSSSVGGSDITCAELQIYELD